MSWDYVEVLQQLPKVVSWLSLKLYFMFCSHIFQLLFSVAHNTIDCSTEHMQTSGGTLEVGGVKQPRYYVSVVGNTNIVRVNHCTWYPYSNSTDRLIVALFLGHCQILSHTCGEKLGEGLGSLLLHRPEMVDTVATNQVHIMYYPCPPFPVRDVIMIQGQRREDAITWYLQFTDIPRSKSVNTS